MDKSNTNRDTQPFDKGFGKKPIHDKPVSSPSDPDNEPNQDDEKK